MGFGFDFLWHVDREHERHSFEQWLIKADEGMLRQGAEKIHHLIYIEEGVKLHLNLSHLLLRHLEIGDSVDINNHHYRIAIVESDRPQHQTTDLSIELIRDDRVVAIDTAMHDYRKGPLWDTSSIPQDKTHWDGERGNRYGRRGTNPGIQIQEASTEDLRFFKAECADVVVGFFSLIKTRLLKISSS